MFFYEPQNGNAGHKEVLAQQTDIMPTLLDMLHFPKPFMAFGGSLLRENEPRFSLSYLNRNYQLIQDGYAWQTDHTVSNALYNLKSDSLLINNLYPAQQNTANQRDKLLKSVLQQYNNRMIENKLSEY
jgi:arylsulfatase A-like enzyme